MAYARAIGVNNQLRILLRADLAMIVKRMRRNLGLTHVSMRTLQRRSLASLHSRNHALMERRSRDYCQISQQSSDSSKSSHSLLSFKLCIVCPPRKLRLPCRIFVPLSLFRFAIRMTLISHRNSSFVICYLIAYRPSKSHRHI